MVDRLNDAVQKAIQADAAQKPTEEKKEVPLHQRIFGSKEEAPEAAAAAEPKAEEPAAVEPVKEEKAKPAKAAKKKAAAATDPHDKEDVEL